MQKKIPVTKDIRYPCEYMYIHKRGVPLLRIRPYGKRISIEFNHIITDGTGAFEFMSALLSEYFGIPPIHIHKEAEENAFQKYFKGNFPHPEKKKKVFQLQGKRFKGRPFFITTIKMPIKEIISRAHEKKVSITEYMAAIHLYTLQTLYEKSNTARLHGFKTKICLEIPVNLRTLFPSQTLRNFFVLVPIIIDRRLGHWSFDEILVKVHHSLRIQKANNKDFFGHFSRSVGNEIKLANRLTPLFLKNITLRLFYDYIIKRTYSGSLSNIGEIHISKELAEHIHHFDFIPARDHTLGATVTVASWQDTLTITIGSVLRESEFEKQFVRTLSSQNIIPFVESNR